MKQFVSAVSLVVPCYDRALEFYAGQLAFDLIEDTPMAGGKRWVLVAPPGSQETRILLAKAATPAQEAAVGQQAAGRVFLFLATDDFDRDYRRMRAARVVFEDPPRSEPYGKVAVFSDPFGNRWDLIEPADQFEA